MLNRALSQMFGLALTSVTFCVLVASSFLVNDVHAASISLRHNTWSLVSIPASNRSGDSPAQVFSEELPAENYGSSGSWALYRYEPQDNAYTLVPVDAELQVGVGYWMIQITESDINIDLSTQNIPFSVSSSTACPTRAGCVEVPLQKSNGATPKWGLLGYPQASQQLLRDTTVRTPEGACSDGCTPDEAQSAGVLSSTLYYYDGSEYQPIAPGSNLKPGEAYWAKRPEQSSQQAAQWLVPSNTTVKVAFTADQSVSSSAEAVLQLIASEGTDLLLLQGDFGYAPNTADTWEEQLNEHLGFDFPVLSVVGNHENHEWPLYKTLITDRVNRVPDLNCNGDVGEKAVCSYRGLQVVHVATGITEVDGVKPKDDYPEYIDTAFENSSARWRICSWHKNQRSMQTGNKGDAAGWGVYQACLSKGAMVATGHEHAYSRTHLMSDFQNQTVKHTNSTLEIKPGQSFAFVSGLGGTNPRPQQRGGDWWASIYTETQNATHGALFCSFNGLEADCYFKAVNGAVPDTFTLLNRINPPPQ